MNFPIKFYAAAMYGALLKPDVRTDLS